MDFDTPEFETALDAYRSGVDSKTFAAAVEWAHMICEPSGCKEESTAEEFFCYLSEALGV